MNTHMVTGRRVTQMSLDIIPTGPASSLARPGLGDVVAAAALPRDCISINIRPSDGISKRGEQRTGSLHHYGRFIASCGGSADAK